MSKITNIAKNTLKQLNQGQVVNQKPPALIVKSNSIAETLTHNGLFSADECTEIMALAAGHWEEALVAETLATSDTATLKEDTRNNHNFMLIPGKKNLWVFEKLLAIVTSANKEFYQFEINQFNGIQISKYEVGEYYHDHLDIGPGVLGNRKISLTLQLSDPDSYEGGDLVLDFMDFPASRELGSVTLFPSFLKHGVRTVTKGTRYSLVAWVSGEHRFR